MQDTVQNLDNVSPQHHYDYQQMANAVRVLAMDAVERANSGHTGLPLGMADIATVLYARFLKFTAFAPTWPDRDRVVLSAGHGSMLLYALNYLCGYPHITMDEIKNFRQVGSLTPGHPEVMPEAGIETTTGPLGQGISNAVGMALAERLLHGRFGSELVDHHTYVIASDGDLMEGVSHESCAIAGHLKLGKLIVLYDDNGTTIDGNTELAFSEDTMARFEAYGWHVQRADGHDYAAIEDAIEAARQSDKPSIIAFRTRIGYCAPNKEGTAGAHDGPYGEEEVAAVRKKLGWHHEPFEIPDKHLSQWRQAGEQSRPLYQQWQERLDACDEATSAAFYNAIAGHVTEEIAPIIDELKAAFAAEQENLATRHASGRILDKLVRAIPELVGGSADLSGSNKTKVKDIGVTTPANDYSGQYIHYGVREHGMAAIMNGMALHGGIIPYGGTFLTFSDYCRPAIRLAALMQIRTIFVMTHDSIGVGEDGPTHQPVEQIPALRAMPGLRVFRPCDGVEAAECWQLALNNLTGPSVLALTRQKVAHNRGPDSIAENKSAKGGYIIRHEGNEGSPQVVLFAAGSEVGVAMQAAGELAAQDVDARVVALPCIELFFEQDASYRQSVAGPDNALKIGVEATVRQGWDAIIGPDGLFIGMDSFGESGPAGDVFAHFGITAEAVAETALQNLDS